MDDLHTQRNLKLVTALMIVALSILMVTNTSWSAAENYPTKPIQVVISYAPGDTDANLRPFIDKMPEFLGQPMFFVYKPGGSGAVGASFVAKANPDGYTIIGTSPGPVLMTPFVIEGLDYTLDDFVPICRLAISPNLLVVRTDSPLKTLNDLVLEAKKSPGKLTYGTSGTFGSPHTPMLIFSKLAGIELTHVPCKGCSPAVTALLGGHVDMTSCTMAPIAPHIRSGALRALGLHTSKRSRVFPDIPTFSELGYPVVFNVWFGLMAPKGVPKEVVEKILDASKKVVEQRKEFIEERMKLLGIELAFLGPKEWLNEIKTQGDMFREVVRDAKEKGKK